MLEFDCFNQYQSRKRRQNDFHEPYYDENGFCKRNKMDSEKSIYDTCGEVFSQDESWSKDAANEKLNHTEDMNCSFMEEEENNSPLEIPILMPSGHRGRSMNDYCTVLSVKKTKQTKGIDGEDITMTISENEPLQIDTLCQGCKIVIHDHSYLIQCTFCSRSFCNTSCTCRCEHCGLIFCHSTCSTLNYSSIFAKTLCLDCNSEEEYKGNYYSK